MLCNTVEGLLAGAYIVAALHALFCALLVIAFFASLIDPSLNPSLKSNRKGAVIVLMDTLARIAFNYVLFGGLFKRDVKKLQLWINFSVFYCFPIFVYIFVYELLDLDAVGFMTTAVLLAVLGISIKVVKDLHTKLTSLAPVSAPAAESTSWPA